MLSGSTRDKTTRVGVPLAVLLVSGLYYYLLSAKVWTWIFVSYDSGDWLACANMWMVPQPFGSPLYISLARAVNLLPGDLVVNMTVILSVIPMAITVCLIYLIVKEMTGNLKTALVCSAVMLGAAVPLSQATVVEEYALAVMFVVLAFYFYIRGKRWATALSLGLGTAVHIMVLVISLIWFVLNARNIKPWLKVMPVYIASGILPYGLILWLMASDAPPLLAGGELSWAMINSYLGSTGVAFSLSVVEAPRRLLYVGAFLVVSLGLAVIPCWRGLKRPWKVSTTMLIGAAGFSIWYYATCLDPTTWTFLIWAIPMMVILAGMGLGGMQLKHTRIVLAGAICLIAANGFFLNADRLTSEDPQAVDYYNALVSLPDGSAVVTHHGGWGGLGFDYVYSEGKDLIPIFFHYEGKTEPEPIYSNYLAWLKDKHKLEGGSTRELARDALDKGIPVYIEVFQLPGWDKVFLAEDVGVHRFKQVTAVDMDAPPVTGNIVEVKKWNLMQELWEKLKGFLGG